MTIPALNCGVYAITHLPSGKRYIGSSVNVKHRLCVHRWNLKGNKHPNAHLQNAYNKYGIQEFSFEKILVCSPENAILYEQLVLDSYRAYDKALGFNIRTEAKSNRGIPSPLKGRPHPSKGKKINRTNPPWNKGIPMSEEQKKKCSDSQKKRLAMKKAIK